MAFQTRAPQLVDGAFIVSRFYRGARNNLGGYFTARATRPARARVRLRRGRLDFRYRGGRRRGTAALWIDLFDSTAPPSRRTYLDVGQLAWLSFAVRGSAAGTRLTVAVADRFLQQASGVKLLGELGSFLPSGKLTGRWQQAWIPLQSLPKEIDRHQLASIGLLALTDVGGRVQLRDLVLLRSKEALPPATAPPASKAHERRRALWIWTTDRIASRAEGHRALAALCAAQGITDAFVQIPYRAKLAGKGGWRIDWRPETQLRPLVAALRQAGVARVHALDGAPELSLAKNHDRALTLVEALVGYNRRVAANERFAGVRYDNEIYLLPSFASAAKRRDLLRQHLTLLRRAGRIARAAGMTLGADIPFWFDAHNRFLEPAAELDGRPASQWIIDAVDDVAVMDYRTEVFGADGLLANAAGELRYAARRGKRVFVGLELGELPDELQLELTPDEPGKPASRAVLRWTGGDKLRVALLPGQRWRGCRDAVRAGRPRVLAQRSLKRVAPTRLTFSRSSAEQLSQAIEQATVSLEHSAGFAAFAIHDYASYRRWLLRTGGRVR